MVVVPDGLGEGCLLWATVQFDVVSFASIVLPASSKTFTRLVQRQFWRIFRRCLLRVRDRNRVIKTAKRNIISAFNEHSGVVQETTAYHAQLGTKLQTLSVIHAILSPKTALWIYCEVTWTTGRRLTSWTQTRRFLRTSKRHTAPEPTGVPAPRSPYRTPLPARHIPPNNLTHTDNTRQNPMPSLVTFWHLR